MVFYCRWWFEINRFLDSSPSGRTISFFVRELKPSSRPIFANHGAWARLIFCENYNEYAKFGAAHQKI